MNIKILSVIVPLALLGACASIPKPIAGEFALSAPKDAATGLQPGTTVRWGGLIVSVQPQPNDTCFEVLAKDLSPGARPVLKDVSTGRFIACRDGFFDPEVFVKGRELTVVGRFERIENRKIGDYDYPFPVLKADVVYLWPERVQTDRVFYAAPFFGPTWWDFYHPFPYRYRSGGNPHVIGTPVSPTK
jgi:outer membrane lipoprotein